MIGWKFLEQGMRSPFALTTWPAPLEWIESEGPLQPCRSGIHFCTRDDLSRWVHDELWELEVDGEVQRGFDASVGRRARLVRRIEAWSASAREVLLSASIEHARELVTSHSVASARAAIYLEHAATLVRSTTALRLHAAALAVANVPSPNEARVAYDAERIWQSRHLAEMLSLS